MIRYERKDSVRVTNRHEGDSLPQKIRDNWDSLGPYDLIETDMTSEIAKRDADKIDRTDAMTRLQVLDLTKALPASALKDVIRALRG